MIAVLIRMVTSQMNYLAEYNVKPYTGFDVILNRLRSTGALILNFSGTQNHQPFTLLSIPFFFIAVYGFFSLRKDKRNPIYLITIISIAIIAAISLFFPAQNEVRYLLEFYPLYLIVFLFGLKKLEVTYPFFKRTYIKFILLTALMLPSMYNTYIFLFIQRSQFNRLDSKAFTERYKQVLSSKPVLLLDYNPKYEIGYNSLETAELSYFLRRGEMSFREIYFTDVFSKRRTLKELIENPSDHPSKNDVLAAFIRNPSLDEKTHEFGWKNFQNRLFVKVWPAGTPDSAIVKEAKEIGFVYHETPSRKP